MECRHECRIFNFFDKNIDIATMVISNDFTEGHICISKLSINDVIPPLYIMSIVLEGFFVEQKKWNFISWFFS